MTPAPENPPALKKGSYVLATKYYDGDPQDHWAVGFYDRLEGGRHYVTDLAGKQFRGNGFRRVKKITTERGFYLLLNSKEIELSGLSVWHFAHMSLAARTQPKPTP